MRSTLVALLAVLGLGCAPLHPRLEQNHEILAAQLASETVELVQNLDEGGQHVYCSGTWVSVDEILTAAHCVSDLEVGADAEYAVQAGVSQTPDGVETYATHEAALEYVEPAHDLALLRAYMPPLAHGVAMVGLEDLRAGQVAYAEGAPKGFGWTFSAGEISQIRYVGDDSSAFWFVQATTPISPGSSGCGLYDANGDLIGVARMYVRNAENLNFFVHRDHVVAFLLNAHAGRHS